MADDDEDDDESGSGGGIPTDVIKSYLAFAKRALIKRRLLIGIVFVGLAGLTLGVVSIWPRTYHCEARLMATQSQILATRGDNVADALRSAGDVITRRENLEAIVKQTDLLRLWKENRPPVLRFKDAVMAKIRGPVNDKDMIAGLIWSLDEKITVDPQLGDGSLTVAVDWSDGPTAARLVQAAVDNYLESRHVAEISTIAEYASILEGHAAGLRTEVDAIAKQIRELRREKVAVTATAKASQSKDEPAAPRARRPAAAPREETPADPEIASLKVMLENKERAIKELDEYRQRRLFDLQAKLSDLLTNYTEAHPAVLDAKQNIKLLEKPSPQVTTLKEEVRGIQAEMDRLAQSKRLASGTGSGLVPAAGATAPSTAGGAPRAPSGAEPLSPDIMSLMQESVEDLDPAVIAQLRYAVDKFSSLRGQISSARIDLDTAHAAFKHRYKMVTPPEVPTKATKPKVPAIIGGGIAASLVIAILVALLAELRTGRIVERWQVYQLSLPVLGELRFPPRSPDS